MVTILSSDIRGFTAMSANMDAADVVDMLNSYFSRFGQRDLPPRGDGR